MMDKKDLKVIFKKDEKKRSILVKSLQNEATDENLKSLATFISEFIEGTRENIIKITQTQLQ